VLAPVRDVAVLGGYGSGKSTGGMMRLKRHCSLNGFDKRPKGRAQKVPKAAIVAPTFKVLDGATRDTFEAVFPPEWIRRRKGSPRPYVELVNGVVIELHSGPTLEGSNYFAILVEEIQHRAYSERQWSNFAARPRDKNAQTLTETYTGLPEEGRVRGRFDREPRARSADGEHGGHWTIMCSTHENTELPREVLAAILASVPSSEGEKLILGRWMQPQGALFPAYDSALHVRPAEVSNEITHLAIDPGALGAVVFGQLRPMKALLPAGLVRPNAEARYDDIGLHIVGQLLPEGQGVEGVCQAIVGRSPKWPIVPGASKIFLDPSASVSIDDERTIRRFFPGVQVLRASKEAGGAEERAKGINRALRDSVGTVRLTFASTLAGAAGGRGVLQAMTGSQRSPRTLEIIDDGWLEHARDALGYLVEGLLPRPYRHAGLPTVGGGRSFKRG